MRQHTEEIENSHYEIQYVIIDNDIEEPIPTPITGDLVPIVHRIKGEGEKKEFKGQGSNPEGIGVGRQVNDYAGPDTR